MSVVQPSPRATPRPTPKKTAPVPRRSPPPPHKAPPPPPAAVCPAGSLSAEFDDLLATNTGWATRPLTCVVPVGLAPSCAPGSEHCHWTFLLLGTPLGSFRWVYYCGCCDVAAILTVQQEHDVLQGRAGANFIHEHLAGLGQLESLGRQVISAGWHANRFASVLRAAGLLKPVAQIVLHAICPLCPASAHGVQLHCCTLAPMHRSVEAAYSFQPSGGPQQRLCNWAGVPE